MSYYRFVSLWYTGEITEREKMGLVIPIPGRTKRHNLACYNATDFRKQALDRHSLACP